jgi:hypothetical protein
MPRRNCSLCRHTAVCRKLQSIEPKEDRVAFAGMEHDCHEPLATAKPLPPKPKLDPRYDYPRRR